MHFRLGTPQDFAACAALLESNGCFRPTASVAGRWQTLWQRLLEKKLLCSFIVWEESTPVATDPPLSFGMSVIVHDRFVAQMKERGTPWCANLLYEELLCDRGNDLLLDQRETAQVNARDGVNIFVLHNPMRFHHLTDPRNEALLPLGHTGFYFCHEGFYIKSVLWEVYGQEHAGFIGGGGYRELHDYSSHPDIAGVEADRVPFLYALEREVAGAKSYQPNHLWLFTRKQPRMRFTSKQQQYLACALLGQSDRELQAALGVSEDAVKQAWKSIMQRAAQVQPERFSREPSTGEGRGQSRRHMLLAYLRQHMEELRPYDFSVAAE